MLSFKADKAKAQIERLIAWTSLGATNNHVFVPTDSNAYTYSDSRGIDKKQPSFVNHYAFDTDNIWVATQGSYSPLLIRKGNYDSQDRMLSNVGRYSQTGAYYDSTVCFYNPDGRCNTTITYLWNASSGNWKPSGKNLFHYDAQYRADTLTYQAWSNTLSAWVNGSRTSYIFSGAGTQLSEYTELGISNNQWQPYSKKTSVYVSNTATDSTRFWSVAGSIWKDSVIDIRTLDQGLTLSDTTLQLSGGLFMKKTLTTYEYDLHQNILHSVQLTWNTGSWLPMPGNNEDRYYYNYLSNTVNEVTYENCISVFPNPASTVLYVHSTDDFPVMKASLYNITGGLVISHDQSGTTQTLNLNISMVPVGEYVLRLQSNKGVRVRSVIVHH